MVARARFEVFLLRQEFWREVLMVRRGLVHCTPGARGSVSGLFQFLQVFGCPFSTRESLVHVYQQLGAVATATPHQCLVVQQYLALGHSPDIGSGSIS